MGVPALALLMLLLREVGPRSGSGCRFSDDEFGGKLDAAWARWSGWKNTLDFPEAVREELSKYPYLLSVPIQQSPEYEEGLLAYGYSIILEHVEKQNPGCIGNALNNLKPSETGPVGTQLYHYLGISQNFVVIRPGA